MANNNNNDMISVNFRINKNDWQELDNNINTSKSQFIRDAIKKQNEKDTDIKELRKKLMQLENDKKLIECEIKDTKKLIHELNEIQTENENNTILIMDKMETINNIVNNQGGITEKQIKTIANNELKPQILIKECEKQGLKIINENKINKDKQGNIINVKSRQRNEPINKDPLISIINIFNRSFRSDKAKYNNDKSKFLKANETRFKTMCQNKGISYNKFLDHVLKDVE